MRTRLAITFLLSFVADQTLAASFDCSKASSFSERQICADGYLSKVDEVLASSYKKALATTAQPEALRQSQRQWLAERDQCDTQKCLDKSLGGRIQVLNNYAATERNKDYEAEQRLQQEQREVQRQIDETAAAQRAEQSRAAQEQARLQPQQVAAQEQIRATVPHVIEKTMLQKIWQWFTSGPAWKYTLLAGALITALAVWRHHNEDATIYADYTDAAISNLLPLASIALAFISKWLEMPEVVFYTLLTAGIGMTVLYVGYASTRSNRKVFDTLLVMIAKLFLISAFYLVLLMLIAPLFVSTKYKGESQARAAARNRRQNKATMAQIAALSTGYTAVTLWLCRRPEFTPLAECLAFEPPAQLV